MSPHADGLFCSTCAEPVIDLTTWRREDIVRYLEQHPRICGQLMAEQLDPSLVPVGDVLAPVRKLSLVALAAAWMALGAQAQDGVRPPATEQVRPDDSIPVKAPPTRIDANGNVNELRDGRWVCPMPEEASTVRGPSPARRWRKHLYLVPRFPFFVVRGPMRGRVAYRRARIF